MELLDRISCLIDIKKQNKEFDKLYPDILFTRYYLLYEEQKNNEKPDGELVKAAYNCALIYENAANTYLVKWIKGNIQKEYGYSQGLIKYNYCGTIDNNNTALEKMKKYIYSSIPVLTFEDKEELIYKVFDISQVGLSKDYHEDIKIDSFWKSIFGKGKTDVNDTDTVSEEQ